MTPTTTTVFRFLDLPPEIRLMVYDQIDTTTHLHVYDGHLGFAHHFNPPIVHLANPNDKPVTIVSVYSTLSISVLLINRFIHDEAHPTFARSFKHWPMNPSALLPT